MAFASDHSGKRFGRLIAQKRHPENTSNGKPRWICLCDCGEETIVAASNLSSGSIKSCGCFRSDRIIEQNTTHGYTGTPEHGIWEGMKKRCYLKTHPSYHNYGGRGITVCQRWLDSFENFLADMGLRPSEEHSIEREENDGNYEPDNCRWATKVEQANNRRTNVLHEFQGMKATLAQISRETGIGYSTLFERMRSGGLTIKEAVEKGKLK